MSDEQTWTEDDVARTIVNPLYAGVGGLPALVQMGAWIEANTKLSEDMGAGPHLALMLDVLVDQLGGPASAEQEGRMDETIAQAREALAAVGDGVWSDGVLKKVVDDLAVELGDQAERRPGLMVHGAALIVVVADETSREVHVLWAKDAISVSGLRGLADASSKLAHDAGLGVAQLVKARELGAPPVEIPRRMVDPWHFHARRMRGTKAQEQDFHGERGLDQALSWVATDAGTVREAWYRSNGRAAGLCPEASPAGASAFYTVLGEDGEHLGRVWTVYTEPDTSGLPPMTVH